MGKGNSNINEQKTAGASYILTFYQQVMTIIDYNVQYVNTILELEQIYKDVDITEIQDEHKDLVRVTLQNLRYVVQKSYIQYKTIKTSIKGESKQDDKIEELYKKIKDNFMINREDVEKYTLELNKFLMDDIVKELIENSQTMMHDIYKDGKTTS